MNIILTGGHTGLGLELTKMLLQENHKLGLIIRSEKRKSEVLEHLGSDKVEFFYADLSNQEAVKAVGEAIVQAWGRVDGLFNNAGVLLDKPYESPQGNEMHYEVNALAPYVLTQALKPALEKGEQPFVVTTLTTGLHNHKDLDIEDLKQPKKFVKLMGSYLKSKQAALQLMNHLARQWQGIRFVSVDPGPNKTKMTSGSGMPTLLRPLRNLFFAKPTVEAKKIYNAAFEEQFTKGTGLYVSGNTSKNIRLTLSQAGIDSLLEGIKA